MTSLTYSKLVVDLFTFSHGGNWNKQGGHVAFDMASGPFKRPGSALMWPCSTLKNPLGLKITPNKWN